MSINIEIFPSVKEALKRDDISNNLYKLYEVSSNKLLKKEDILDVDKAYRIKHKDTTIAFLNFFQTEPELDTIEVLYGYLGKGEQMKNIEKIYKDWMEVGLSVSIEFKVNQKNIKKYLNIVFEIVEKMKGVICIKETFDEIDNGFYTLDGFKKIIES